MLHDFRVERGVEGRVDRVGAQFSNRQSTLSKMASLQGDRVPHVARYGKPQARPYPTDVSSRCHQIGVHTTSYTVAMVTFPIANRGQSTRSSATLRSDAGLNTYTQYDSLGQVETGGPSSSPVLDSPRTPSFEG